MRWGINQIQGDPKHQHQVDLEPRQGWGNHEGGDVEEAGDCKKHHGQDYKLPQHQGTKTNPTHPKVTQSHH